mgnify:CR=1 FL=1
MSCFSHQWCPQCEQLIADMTCACLISCDRHGDVCTPVIPDGTHEIRYKGKPPHSTLEYRNQWIVGRYIVDYETRQSKWDACEPGHPTKTPWEVEQEWRAAQAVKDQERRRVQAIERQALLNGTEGGGI